MEILLRKHNKDSYVWKPATWKNNCYYIEDDFFDIDVPQKNILSVRNDNRTNLVVCGHCGALVENNPEAIEQHYAEQEAKKNCLTCEYVRTYGGTYDEKTEYEPTGKGDYLVKKTFYSYLGCSAGYWTKEINSKDAKANCIYAQCRRKGMMPINDIFVKYPDPFNTQITIDLLKAKKFNHDGYIDGFFDYDLKMRGTLKACVNELGIVDHFKLFIKGYEYWLYYSEKYNKLFNLHYGRYDEDLSRIMTASKAEQVLEKISTLYKEAQTNE